MSDLDVGELRGRVDSIEARLDRIERKVDRLVESFATMTGGRKMLFALLSLVAAMGAGCAEAVHILWRIK